MRLRGSPVSAIVANLLMEWLEGEAIATVPMDIKPKLWRRYVDDYSDFAKIIVTLTWTEFILLFMRSYCHSWVRTKTFRCVYVKVIFTKSLLLTGGNWQKWKRVFLTCPCHEIYRDEAVGLKVAKILEKLRYLWKCEILGQYRENLIFCQ